MGVQVIYGDPLMTGASSTKINSTSIAPAYSTTSAYAVGDIVSYKGATYKCTTAIASGGETWTAAHWTAYVVETSKQDKIYVQDSEPSNPKDGDMWIDTDDYGSASTITVENTPTSGSTNAISSGAAYTIQSTVTNHSSQIEELTTDKADKTALALTDKKLDYLAALTKGQAWSESTGTTPAYSHTVAKGAKAVEIKKIGGKTIKYNQPVSIVSWQSRTYEGITFTNNNDGSYTANGTATGNGAFAALNLITTISGDKYYLFGGKLGDNVSTTMVYFQNENTSINVTDGAVIATIPDSSIVPKLWVNAGETVNNRIFYPQCIDLTSMFGSGNEPSLAQCKAMFPSDYYPYSANTLLSADVTAVTSKEDDGTTTMGTLSIPQVGTHAAFSALYPLRSAGSVYDEIDIVNKKHIKRVGVVDLGTLTWFYQSDATRNYFYSSEKINKPYGSSENKFLCAKYTTASYRGAMEDKNISVWNLTDNNAVCVQDSSYTDTASFKTAMSGVMLYYELATAVETDISAYFTDDNLLDCEYNGTLTFTQGNKVGSTDADIRIPVPNGTTYMINNLEATT